MISSTSFVTKWYITLFANTVPFQTQLRLWDAFLLEGRDVLVVAAVAVLWIVKGALTGPGSDPWLTRSRPHLRSAGEL